MTVKATACDSHVFLTHETISESSGLMDGGTVLLGETITSYDRNVKGDLSKQIKTQIKSSLLQHSDVHVSGSRHTFTHLVLENM